MRKLIGTPRVGVPKGAKFGPRQGLSFKRPSPLVEQWADGEAPRWWFDFTENRYWYEPTRYADTQPAKLWLDFVQGVYNYPE